MKRLLRSAILFALAVAILALLLWYGDAARVADTISRFQPSYLLAFMTILLAQEVVRGVLWNLLLRALSMDVPVSTQAFAFAAAESVKVAPAGVYLQNYLVQRLRGSDVGRSSAATTAMILGEIVAALIGVIVLGVATLGAWIRLIVVVGVAAAIVATATCLLAPYASRLPMRLHRQRLVSKILDELQRFRAGIAVLLRPGVIVATLTLSGLYIVLAGIGLYVVVSALGIAEVTFREALIVTCFGLAFYVILGSLEAAGVAAFVASGVDRSDAVSTILVNRALGIVGVLVLSFLVMASLPNEWRALFHPSADHQPSGSAE
jgi:uncharacterized membrane protein YbhN (UPF0104 family)